MLDVAIIGGGPGAQAAALQLAPHSLSVTVFDEQARAGGQILRQSAQGVPANSYPALAAQLAAFEALPLDWRGSHSVLGIAAIGEGFRVDAVGPTGVVHVEASKLLVAAGCQDVAVPVPGWTLPGVMAAGGLQAFIKAQGLVPGNAVLLIGTHPLMLLIADQITRAGGHVVGVLFAQARTALAAALVADPLPALRGAGNLLDAARAWRRLRRAGIPVRFGARLAELQGTGRVAAALLESGERIGCDTVGLCFGFVPQAELIRAVGAKIMPAGGAGGWRGVADAWMESTVPGLYLAGETLGVAGAPAAAAGGAIAGIGIAHAFGMMTEADAARRAAPFRRDHGRALRFAALLDRIADPGPHWPAVTPDTLACRCENVSFGTLETALATATTANTVKRLTRCGMGVCQGRNCEPTLLRMLARRGHDDDPGFAARYPARPVAIGDLLG